MKTYPMQASQFIKYTFIIFLLVGMNACSAKKVAVSSLPLSYMAQGHDGLVFDASFQYKDFQASGLMVMKRIQLYEYHVVLLSKFGPALMEFKLTKAGITWIKSFEQLEKRVLSKFIAKDFNLLLLSILEEPKKVKSLKANEDVLIYKIKDGSKAEIKVDADAGRVLYAENKGFPNLFKSKAKFTYGENDIPQNIEITHNNINLRIDMILLKVNHAER